jgi:phospholipase/lecithinase/hemolysin
MKVSAKLLRGCGLLLGVLIVIAGTTVSGDPKFDSLYVFGDSLADNGNDFILSKILGANPAIPPSVSPHRAYFNGRFSNGPLEFEYLWQRLSGQAPGTRNGLRPFLELPVLGPTGAVDFGFGGTGTPLLDQTPGGFYAPGLKGQIELFRAALARRRPSRGALYAVVTGANDYRDDETNVPMKPEDVVKNISDSIVSLYQLGARNVIVLNLPDLGLLPANRDNPGPATQLSQFHNGLLAFAMNDLSAQLPDLHLIQIDLNAVFALLPASMDRQTPALDVLIQTPLQPPFPPLPMSSCLFVNPASCQDVPTFDTGLQFLFWDVVHPTTAVHKILSDFIYNALAH